MRPALACILLAISSPVLANDVQSADPVVADGPGVTTKPAVDDAKICKRIKTTESRLGSKKVCMTKSEWREYLDANG